MHIAALCLGSIKGSKHWPHEADATSGRKLLTGAWLQANVGCQHNRDKAPFLQTPQPSKHASHIRVPRLVAGWCLRQPAAHLLTDGDSSVDTARVGCLKGCNSVLCKGWTPAPGKFGKGQAPRLLYSSPTKSSIITDAVAGCSCRKKLQT